MGARASRRQGRKGECNVSKTSTYNDHVTCGEPECGRTGIYRVGEQVYCSAHKDLAQRAAAAVAAEHDQHIASRYRWGRRV